MVHLLREQVAANMDQVFHFLRLHLLHFLFLLYADHNYYIVRAPARTRTHLYPAHM